MDKLTVPLDLINHRTSDDGTVHLDFDGIRLARPFTIHAVDGAAHYCWPNVQPNGDALEGDCADEPDVFHGSRGSVWFDPEPFPVS